MCRIAAIIGKDYKGAADAVVRMTDAMAHGGPDDVGLFVDEINGVVLGHRRLSIIDLSEAGHQPMADISGQYTISFNGEIYNYEEIRNELIQLGYSFRSNSDTEVLIYGYQHWGTDLLPRLKGMFAFILLDKIKGQLIAARDHAGIKPLYYGHRNGSLYFSSEVRAILAADPEWPQDEHWQVRFLAFGFIPEPFSTLQQLFHLPRASYIMYNLATASLSIHTYIQFPFTSTITSEEEAVSQTRETLLKAVERHLVADVPVGVFLSGGIDSSILTFACRKFNKAQLKTLSIYFEDEKYSEKYYQDLVVEKTGVDHTAFLVTQKDFDDALPDIFNAMDQPSIDGINTYFITRYAKEYGLKVVLSGLGADELFGGYGSFNNKIFDKVNKFRIPSTFLALFIKKYPLRKLRYLTNNLPLNKYLFSRGLFVPDDIANMLKKPLKQIWEVLYKTGNDIPDHLNSNDEVSYVEQHIYMQNQLLRDSDIYSMWHSVELRVPFLDMDVVKLAHAISPVIKYIPQQKKFLLIKAFEKELPQEIWNRAKMGFTFPFENWLLKSPETNRKKVGNNLGKIYDKFKNRKLNWSRYWAALLCEKLSYHKINVVFYHRHNPLKYKSIETYFENIRKYLPAEVKAKVVESKYHKMSIFPIVYNIFQAAFRQGDINHITGEIHYLALGLRKSKTILTIHDVVFMNRYSGIKRRILKLLLITWPVKMAGVITVVSQATKEQLLKFTDCHEDKIHVIPTCIADHFKRIDKPFNQVEPVILQIGTTENKNCVRIAEALNGIMCRLEIIGKPSLGYIRALEKSKVNYHVNEHLTAPQMLAKYAEADVVIFPSTYEGFGMPIIEANTVGRVVVTSNISSMPEVAGGAACLVDPFSVVSISKGLNKVIVNSNYREQLINKGYDNANRFLLSKVAGQYHQLYQSIN